MNTGRLVGKVALVTGGSRGIGKGIAQVLIEEGATVYITGRIHHSKNLEYPDVFKTAEELNSIGRGKCIAMYCDHSIDSDTQLVFDDIQEKYDKLDILVNNAFSGLDLKKEYSNKKFWEHDPGYMWKITIDVGLRSNYICSCKAISLMLKKNEGLIINISSFGGIVSLFNPCYGVGKEGIDRLTVELANFLKEYNINVISLWPGIVRTEIMSHIVQSESSNSLKSYWNLSESVFLTGRAVKELYLDPNVRTKSGKIAIVADVAHEYGFTDVDGLYPSSALSLRFYVGTYFPSLVRYIPHFLQLPKWILSYYYSKF